MNNIIGELDNNHFEIVKLLRKFNDYLLNNELTLTDAAHAVYTVAKYDDKDAFKFMKEYCKNISDLEFYQTELVEIFDGTVEFNEMRPELLVGLVEDLKFPKDEIIYALLCIQDLNLIKKLEELDFIKDEDVSHNRLSCYDDDMLMHLWNECDGDISLLYFAKTRPHLFQGKIVDEISSLQDDSEITKEFKTALKI